ncbi:outer membrane protein assembly factor BamA [Aequorivita antarctica]|uniref:Outer membrane protein assembly factor BamA n=1 Tax=Aequorivita antarctica TaxID=153266 RepID=A0A5C6YWJ2_9FLAO|nr:outer membrane protein assembly factor BamA [Aequorivita antarctica]TXD71755.1 outer membrane protein assembly factor BamA [Aequorivita antarctica]SRX75548.1 Outer membrane protein assembly factor BamA [Aequorivita antarctica]
MNNLINSSLLHTYRKSYCILLFTILSVFTLQAQQKELDSGKKYTINNITVAGAQSFNEQTVVAFTGLKKGDRLYIPGEKLSQITKKLWEQNLFSDIAFYVTNIEGDNVDLELYIVELPKLHEVTITGKGIRKAKQKEIIKDNDLNAGTKITKNLLNTTKNYISNKYKKEGYYNTDVTITTTPFTDSTGVEISKNMTISINRGKRVKVKEINFEGNEQFTDGKLRRSMKKTKRKNFARVWKRSKFTEEGFEEDRVSLLKKYKSNGYRDARILSDTLRVLDKKNIALDLKLEEGDKYYFGEIKFIGNSVFTDSQLRQVLGIKEGDIYNGVLLQERIQDDSAPDAEDMTNLYQNNGYLAARINPVEVAVRNDTIDFEIRIMERSLFYFDHVTVIGNDRTNDHVIYRELRTRPGQKYSKRDVIRTIRELGQLGFFDPEQLSPNFKKVDENNGLVDLEYSVVEKGSSQIELQGGYGGGGFVGTLGLSFNNFSLRNIFNFKAYKPLPMGDGQKLSLRAQASSYYQTYSLSLTEPWLGGKKPVQLSTSFTHTIQNYYDYNNRQADKSRSFTITGGSVGLAKKIKWPDDYFVWSNAISFQHYNLNNYNTGLFTFGDGYSNNLAYTIGISRNNTATNPIYPTQGSDFSITAKLTIPYSAFNNIDYKALSEERDQLDLVTSDNPNFVNASKRISEIDQERFKWLEYYKIKFKGTWYTRLYEKLVLRTNTELGFLGAYNQERGVPPFERFFLGGDGLGAYSLDGREVIQLRGYPNQSLSDVDGNTIYNKFSLEVRYPVTLAQMASIYVLGFAESGASYTGFKDYNPFELKRSAGAGLRIFMPAFGLLGIDFGYGFDPVLGGTEPNGWQTHFIIGQQF